MSARLSLSRLRRRRSNSKHTGAVPGQGAYFTLPSPATSDTFVQPDRLQLIRVRNALRMISGMLDEVDSTVLDILGDPEEGLDEQENSGNSMSSVSPLAMSIDLHLANLQRSSGALGKLVTKYTHVKERKSDNLDDGSSVAVEIARCSSLTHQPPEASFAGPVTPDQPARYPLPDQDSRLSSSGPGSLFEDDTCFAYSQDFPPSLRLSTQQYSSPPETSPLYVAPLNLPAKGFSAISSKSISIEVEDYDMRSESFPFEYEIEYLDEEIGETLDLERRHSNLNIYPPSIQRARSLRSVRSIDSNLAFVERSSPDSGSAPWASSKVYHSGSLMREGLSSASHGLESIEETESDLFSSRPSRSYHSRHFSTEEKTRRLRSRRRGSAPCGLDANSDEPLRMEELMEYLREGHSIREL